MSTYHAVEAVSRAIVGLLDGAPHSAEFVEAKFALFRVEDFEKPMESGISIYLYRVAVDTASRNRAPVVARGGGRPRPPIALSLHYLLTAWGTDAESEHRLLAWAMRVLADTPILPGELLNLTSVGAFRPNETVELTLEDLALSDELALWRGMRFRHRLSMSYAARLVMIDSAVGTN